MLATNRVEADIRADIAIQHEFDARRFQLFDPAHDNGLFQLEAGDAIGHQPARAVVAVIDRDLHASAAQHIRCRQTAGTSADDGDRFGAVSGGGDGLNPAFFPRRVGDVFFQPRRW